MNASTLRGGIAATTLFLVLGAAVSVSAQTPSSAGQRQDPLSQGSDQRGMGMKDIGDAYLHLQRVSLNTLRQEAGKWKEERAGESGDSDSRDVSASSASLRGDELLIAACSKGLVAGAPSSTTMASSRASDSSDRGDRASGPQRTPVEQNQTSSRQAASDGQAVGMILVCAHSTDDASRASGTSDRREKQAREASGEQDRAARSASAATATGKLEPGVYCVKQSGQSVWLTDEEGQVVLRATMDAHSGKSSSKLGDSRDQDPSGELGSRGLGDRSDDRSEWEHVFGAITKEAMTSMGWSESASFASR